MNISYEKRSGDKIQIIYREGDAFAPHRHMANEVVFVEQGKVNVKIDNVSYCANKQEIIIIPKNTLHEYLKTDNTKYFIVICDINKALKGREINHTEVVYDKIFVTIFSELISEFRNKGYFFETIIATTVNQFIIQYYRRYPFWFTYNGNVKLKSDSLLEFVNENIDRPLTLNSLSTEFNYSQKYISKLFKKYIGINFKEYIDYKRIENAKSLLVNSSENIGEIAMQCGFESVRNFNNIFKKLMKCSPSEYRSREI